MFASLCDYALFVFGELAVQRLLLVSGLFFEDIAFYVGTLAPDLDAHCTRTTLCTGQPQLRLRFTLERDAAWRRNRLYRIVLTVAATQVRQQFEF